MSLDQLRYFVAVAEEQSVTRAAQRLHLSQPPLSRHMRALEEELGVTLLERDPRGVRLLPPGEVLLAQAREILARVASLPGAVQEHSPSPVCQEKAHTRVCPRSDEIAIAGRPVGHRRA